MLPDVHHFKPTAQPRNPGGYSWEDKYGRAALVQPHEPLECYIRGGFHPVALGDTFQNGRYTIRYKLGQWVSLKIKQARASTSSLDEDPEMKALMALEHKHVSSTPSSPKCFAQLLETFQHQGPNGTHTCLVTELLGPAVSSVKMVYNNMDVQETLRPDTILRASKQILECIHAMHESGIVHGDISPGNTAFTCQSILENEDENYILEALGGEPLIADYTGADPLPENLPKHLVETACWPGWFDGPDEDIRLIDWGESFPINETRSQIAQPPDLRSPETFFIGSFDYRHDLWRAGCVIHSLFYQQEPFGFSSCKEQMIQEQIQVIGPLPPKWHEQWLQMIKENPKFTPLR
ncbi:hypothetical protein EsDP_00000724 [Epichloe bromicola]|uniref:Protein kinase domain-containing protein n=1 Tax=Epichloe bromicola TaxID=79588 RepID=A0ABQ0CFR1_9HYPO